MPSLWSCASHRCNDCLNVAAMTVTTTTSWAKSRCNHRSIAVLLQRPRFPVQTLVAPSPPYDVNLAVAPSPSHDATCIWLPLRDFEEKERIGHGTHVSLMWPSHFHLQQLKSHRQSGEFGVPNIFSFSLFDLVLANQFPILKAWFHLIQPRLLEDA